MHVYLYTVPDPKNCLICTFLLHGFICFIRYSPALTDVDAASCPCARPQLHGWCAGGGLSACATGGELRDGFEWKWSFLCGAAAVPALLVAAFSGVALFVVVCGCGVSVIATRARRHRLRDGTTAGRRWGRHTPPPTLHTGHVSSP